MSVQPGGRAHRADRQVAQVLPAVNTGVSKADRHPRTRAKSEAHDVAMQAPPGWRSCTGGDFVSYVVLTACSLLCVPGLSA